MPQLGPFILRRLLETLLRQHSKRAHIIETGLTRLAARLPLPRLPTILMLKAFAFGTFHAQSFS
jgi:hypothetical protein